ncbi:MAG: beta-L-arabinofuranosidase domain-containing protein [Bacteroidota bacterium]
MMSRLLMWLMTGSTIVSAQQAITRNTNYISNREPLAVNPYIQLPLGSISPKGWLYEQLRLSAEGMTGYLDEIWKDVGPENGWLGGKGDSWERGPYWLDGLVPLAYTLRDKALTQKAQKWIEWSLRNQREDGYFGPVADPSRTFKPEERVLAWQEKNKEDWWPHMVMLKVMEQYYEATGDKRVLEFMTRYFQYQLRHLPAKPLPHWTHWAKDRGGENLASIYWLYNRTGDAFLPDLARLVFEQTEDWTGMLESGKPKYWHGVNTGMGVKQPAVWYQQSKDERYLKAVKKGIDDLMRIHGQVQGMFSGDELLHGTDPTQGTELCTVVEYMFSLESLLKITGDLSYAEILERVAFNALPTQVKPDLTGRQYFQLPNQVVCDTNYHNFNVRYKEGILFGLETGYGCCTANLHQGWPKLTAHLWLATQDNGLAAMVYAPSEVTAKVANGIEVTLTEETNYPFDEKVTLRVKASKSVEFPLHLRVPTWCTSAVVLVNGIEHARPKAGTTLRIARTWETGDKVELTLPMEIRLSRWHEEAVGVERGPLVYALKMTEQWKKVKGEGRYATYEVSSTDPWNYGLVIEDLRYPWGSFEVVRSAAKPQPWTADAAPIRLKAKAKKLPDWNLYGGITGPIPWSPVRSSEPTEEITLIPYGCTKLRISEFPVAQ